MTGEAIVCPKCGVEMTIVNENETEIVWHCYACGICEPQTSNLPPNFKLTEHEGFPIETDKTADVPPILTEEGAENLRLMEDLHTETNCGRCGATRKSYPTGKREVSYGSASSDIECHACVLWLVSGNEKRAGRFRDWFGWFRRLRGKG